ncbi:hypothetical protein NEOLEDRAFT_140108 [Neolentinus lepideus HHB14362 ss-1]|uniref:Uncharacterized protein n=1 Tax=Neolentinus lepideus HHB14362 ss-1 TaxID=1314782 RepID=A0A165TZK4_9AGAM|nr:hypothetical protein NEOLEDRAFT_140108 [Neolentinus lepideus HHB14362 ss-1]
MSAAVKTLAAAAHMQQSNDSKGTDEEPCIILTTMSPEHDRGGSKSIFDQISLPKRGPFLAFSGRRASRRGCSRHLPQSMRGAIMKRSIPSATCVARCWDRLIYISVAMVRSSACSHSCCRNGGVRASCPVTVSSSPWELGLHCFEWDSAPNHPCLCPSGDKVASRKQGFGFRTGEIIHNFKS